MTTEAVMFSLLRAEVCGRTVSEEVKASLSEEMLAEVYGLARKHDLAHLVGDALSKLGLLRDNEISQKLKQVSMQAVYRYVRKNHAFGQLCGAFESARIPFLPLKGTVIRDYYPEPWMRTSCDIDVLVHEEDLEQAVVVLTTKLGYKNEGRGYHDVSLFSPSGVHVELHYTLSNEKYLPEAQKIAENVWAYVSSVRENSFQMQMTDEMYYFYHILHMANHFYGGGCGIRPFMDLWILNHKMEFDIDKRERLLREGGLLTFARAAQVLSEVWLSAQAHTDLTRSMEAFVLGGGVYGNTENMAAVQQVKKGGKLSSILYKIFLPYSLLKGHYPILQKHKWLLPFCQIARWFRLLSGARWKRSIRELKANTTVSVQKIATTEDLLKLLDL